MYVLPVFTWLYSLNYLSEKTFGLIQKEGETSKHVNATGASYSIAAKIIREKMKLKNYDKWVRPNDTGGAVEVFVEMKIMAFGKVREDDMDFTLDVFFRQWWTDERLAHGVDKIFNMAADPKKYFWTPDTYFVNVKSSNFHKVTRENMRLMIWPDGKIYYSTRITLTASCEMNLSMFPMDTQVCLLKIESYAYTIEDVVYNWRVRGKEDSSIEVYAAEMAQFDMKSIQTSKRESSNSKGSFDSLHIKFKFKRRSSYFFVQHYIPSSFIVFISWLSFWINKNAVPARVSLTVTCILSTMVLFESINSSLPRISYLKAIDYYLIVSFFFILASMVEYCFVLNIMEKSAEMSRKNSLQVKEELDRVEYDYFRERFPGVSRLKRDANLTNGCPSSTINMNTIPRPIPTSKENRHQQINYDLDDFLPAECLRSGKECVHFVDHYSRKVFPLLYILFNIGYWSYFLPKVD
ncbi:gamma-aminobutyric acid receptor subunit rho-2-like [Actinia tenebrosa]|uniref:Gamma-aminobutyric acid receptor subunit beta n=1 Tax=Actinia tenebrosa TaxID=6105 RepID=A0A6P8JGG6_ACTTE|nr:gamma-aminobutyric acid receptor subunit rho-2-like [Actinia tenebrosa]